MSAQKPRPCRRTAPAHDKWLRALDLSISRYRTAGTSDDERDRFGTVRSGELLYTDEVGHDACGIGGVAARDGKPSAEVLRKAVIALRAMEHRGGVCGDAGDGAGILAAIPQALFKEEAKRLRFDGARELRPEDVLAVGALFVFESAPARAEHVRAIVAEVLSGGPVRLLGFRPIPTNEDALPSKARSTRPAAIEHIVLKTEGAPATVDRWLFLRASNCASRLIAAGLNGYVPSLSARPHRLQGADDQRAASGLLRGPQEPGV